MKSVFCILFGLLFSVIVFADPKKPSCEVFKKPVTVRVEEIGSSLFRNLILREDFDSTTAQGALAFEVFRQNLPAQNALPMGLRNLVIKGGKICASTSGAWLLKALLSPEGLAYKLPPNPSDLVALVVHTANKEGLDVRYGAYLSTIVRALEDIAEELPVTLRTQLVRSPSVPEVLRLRPNTLALMSITDLANPSGPGHAVILLDADPKRQTLRWVDPDYPHVVYRSNYFVQMERGRMSLELIIAAKRKAVINEIAYFRTEKRQTAPQPQRVSQLNLSRLKEFAHAVRSVSLKYRLKDFVFFE